MNTKRRYHGLWSTPSIREEGVLISQMGELLVCDNDQLELNLFSLPKGCLNTRCHYDVLWGEDSRGCKITLIDIQMKETSPGTTTSFFVRYSIVGAHISKKTEPIFNQFCVSYSYLKNWIRRPLSDSITQVNDSKLEVDIRQNLERTILLENDALRITVLSEFDFCYQPNEFRLFPKAAVLFETKQNSSLEEVISIINEFTQFLSFASLVKQNPESVFLCRSDVRESLQLLYRQKLSSRPDMFFLLPLDEMKEQMPDIVGRWHENYSQLAPICKALLQSLAEEEFDAPDFLIVAQALDGYHKRFLNKKNGKDKRKYKEGVDLLLEKFVDVEAIRRINIDSEILAISRNKYSHLIPDDDEKHQKAAEGKMLLLLTRKCKVLLTCCILDLLGLTSQEINNRFNRSYIKIVVENIEREEEMLMYGNADVSILDNGLFVPNR